MPFKMNPGLHSCQSHWPLDSDMALLGEVEHPGKGSVRHAGVLKTLLLPATL